MTTTSRRAALETASTRAAASRDAGAARWGASPRRGTGRAGARRIVAQGNSGAGDVCTDLSGSNTVDWWTCENRRKLTHTLAAARA